MLLVTGGAGFIGSAVVRQAIARGHEIINVDCLTYAGCTQNVASVQDHPSYVFEKVDIRDATALGAVFDRYCPDAVLHLAAESHVDRSIDGPEAFLTTNVMGTFNVLQAARRQGCTVVHVSTDEVFGSLGPTGKFTETTAYDPRSPYSASKAASDHLARAWHATYDLPVIVTNCSNNYGPYQFPEKLIPTVILKALAGQPIPVYGAGTNVRDWLFVEDHADALLCVLETGEIGQSYAIGGETEVANIDLVRMLCGLLDEARPGSLPYADFITFVEDRPGHDQRYAIDPSHIRDSLGWRPSTTLAEGLRQTVAWYLENEDWWNAVVSRDGVGQRLGRG